MCIRVNNFFLNNESHPIPPSPPKHRLRILFRWATCSLEEEDRHSVQLATRQREANVAGRYLHEYHLPLSVRPPSYRFERPEAGTAQFQT